MAQPTPLPVTVIASDPTRGKRCVSYDIVVDMNDPDSLVQWHLVGPNVSHLYAKADIQKGTRILCEPKNANAMEETLPTTIIELGADQTGTYLGQNVAEHREELAKPWENHVGSIPEGLRYHPDRFNALAAAFERFNGDRTALLHHIAAIEHKPRKGNIAHNCQPNAHASYNPTLDMITVYVVRNIPAGEEITISWIHPLLKRKARTTRLVRDYNGAVCDCNACRDPLDPNEISRRQESQQMWKVDAFYGCPIGLSKVPSNSVPRNKYSALACAVARIGILSDSSIRDMSVALANRTCFELCMDCQLYALARDYARQERVIERDCLGVETEYLNDIPGGGGTATRRVKAAERELNRTRCVQEEQQLRDHVYVAMKFVEWLLEKKKARRMEKTADEAAAAAATVAAEFEQE